MFKELKRKLVWIYTATTGVILTLVVMLALFATFRNDNEMYMQIFNTNFSIIAGKLQLENTISNSFIAKQENDNHLIIAMEENGVPLQFLRAEENEMRRDKQLKKLREYAKVDGMNTAFPPVSVSEIYSDVYKWNDGNALYYGRVLMFSTPNGYRSLLMVEKYTNVNINRLKQGLLFLILDLGGVLCLYGVSVWFVKKTLKPVEESKKRQTEFVAAASHELRSPLTVIKANIAAMKQPQKEMHVYAEQMDKECNRMARLVEDMLFLASSDAENWIIHLEAVEVENLLIEVYEDYLPICKEQGVLLEIDLPKKEMAEMKGDKDRMKQVFSILLDNALRFSKEGEKIVIRGRMEARGKRKIQLEVEDHGIGVLEDAREAIFERFYQEDKARSDKNHFGLGLSIAKELVELQEGTIACKETISGGATFFLCFLEMN